MIAIVYSRHYDISFFGIERLHPFDSRKYGRAWRELRKYFGRGLFKHVITVDRPAKFNELVRVHSAEYLVGIRQSKALSAALELPPLRRLPSWLLRWRVLRPMRWAVQGTVLAAKAALERGVAVNMSGGYHHAKPDRGEGFCVYSDIALAVQQLRSECRIQSPLRIAYVDCDAHQGNGVCHHFMHDREVFIFDMFNQNIYPSYDTEARQRIDCSLPVPSLCTGAEYLAILRDSLPGFLDVVSRSQPITLGIYNAGTDVFVWDQLAVQRGFR
ncbi:MAG TPA: histone deacetylase [Gemmataceae bacterium]|nr:histone deacetylase [Gemmataceae bacterium]